MTFIKKFTKYGKWVDLISFKNIECRLSIIFTTILISVFYFLGIFNDFKIFESAFQNLSLNITTALIGMIGIILTGIAIMISVLNKEVVSKIEKVNGDGTVQRVLTSFEFLTFIIAVQILSFISIYLSLYSDRKIPPSLILLLIACIVCYLFTFTIFYTVALVSNSVKIFFITNLYDEIVKADKSIYDEANEIRIEVILNSLLKGNNVSHKDFMDNLNEFIDASEIENKTAVKKYLNERYSVGG